MIVEIFIFIITFIIIYGIYVYKRNHRFFEKNGLKYAPGLPYFGNAFYTTTNTGHMTLDIDAVYKMFPDDKYVGYVEGLTPIIMIRDPEIIKNITVKDFDHFVNRRNFFSDGDELFGGSLLNLKDEKWRDMRATISPAFTGSKMRFILPFMQNIGNNLVIYIKDDVKNKSDITDIDDIMRRYANDVIASTVFGLDVNSLKDKNNDFYRIGQTILQFNFFQNLVFLLAAQFPKLSQQLKIQLLPAKTINFFKDIVSNTINYRKQNKIQRPDMIQLLMDTSKEWTQTEIIGQAFIFFSAGFETSASTLVMCVHELALNPHVEEKLYQEIKKADEAGFDFEKINDLKYMNCVVNETSRKWSAAIILDRTCTKPYELPPSLEGGKPFTIQPGTLIYNVVNSLHTDPKYYPDPDVFDPERFSDENKHNINPFTYLPFGVGPRNCIGSRFAIMTVKVLLYLFVLNFKIHKCDKTMDPIVLCPGFRIKATNGTWVRLESRT